jgi:hypothetical protein
MMSFGPPNDAGALAPMVAWIESTSIAAYVRENNFAFPWLESVHVMAIALVLGVISIVDLRLLGIAGVGYRASRLMRSLLPLTWAAFALAAVTGVLMFFSQPALYLKTPAFQLKLALLVLAGINMAIFHLWTHRSIVAWDAERRTPLGAKLAGLVSLSVWIGVVFAGRFVGFTLSPF